MIPQYIVDDWIDVCGNTGGKCTKKSGKFGADELNFENTLLGKIDRR